MRLFGLELPPYLLSFLTAELLLLLTRYREITILCKLAKQRTEQERDEVDRGLFRSVALQFLLFAPVSVVLLLLIVRPGLRWFGYEAYPEELSFYAWLGLVSYGFPFMTVKTILTRVAIRSLREGLELAEEYDRQQRK